MQSSNEITWHSGDLRRKRFTWATTMSPRPQPADWVLEGPGWGGAVRFGAERVEELMRLEDRLDPCCSECSIQTTQGDPYDSGETIGVQATIVDLDSCAAARFTARRPEPGDRIERLVVVSSSDRLASFTDDRVADDLSFIEEPHRSVILRTVAVARGGPQSLAFSFSPLVTEICLPEVVREFERVLIRAVVSWLAKRDRAADVQPERDSAVRVA